MKKERNMKVNKRNTNITDKTIDCLMILYLYYYSYRYILQYNSAKTSPTYSDTPLFWQTLKFGILLIIVLCYIIRTGKIRRLKICRQNKNVAMGILLLTFQGLVYSFIMWNRDYIVMLVILIPILFLGDQEVLVDLKKIDHIMEVFFIFTVVYEVIQFLLFSITGRLPALAYNTGYFMDVRFGGAWDDPNGFSILLSFYFPYVILKYRGKKRWIHAIIIGTLLLMTWSATGVLSLLAAMCVLLIITMKKKNHIFKVILAMVVVGIGLFMIWVFNQSAISTSLEDYLYIKQGSVKDHMSEWNQLNTSILSWLGLKLVNSGGEIGWMRLATYGGIWSVLGFSVLNINSIKKLVYKMEQSTIREERALYGGMIVYILSLLFSMFNLPLMYNFANIGVASIFIVIACANTQYV
jgi:hypothetical protein